MENLEAPVRPEDEKEEAYWAAFDQGVPNKERFGTELRERVREYFEALEVSGLIQLYQTAHAHFYGLSPGGGGHESSKIIEFGDDGEKLGIRSNQLRSLVRYMVTTTTQERPAVLPKAINATAKAMAQVPTARRVLEYYHKRKKLEKKLNATALRAALYGKGYLWQGWDMALNNGQGDLFYRACSPLETVSDLEREEGEHDWFIMRRPRNKFDAAAIYGGANEELREEILDLPKDCLEKNTVSAISFGLNKKIREDSDILYEYHFLHKRTPALPSGRYAIFAGDGRILFDGPLPYAEMPVDEMIPEEFMEAGSVGYSSAWDLVGLQDWYDGLLSTCITNFDAFGHNDMLLPDGIELSVEEVRDGLNVIRFPPGEFNRPSVLEKFSIREEAFKLRDIIKSDMEINYGVNSVARGEPEPSLKSGAALALIQAQSVQFQSGFVGAYVDLTEMSSTKTIQIVRKFCSPEQIKQIAGETDPDGLRALLDPSMDLISGTECERVNPLFRTLPGRVEVANNLLERGLIENVKQYFTVIETGRLEPVTDPPRKCEAMIQAENEILMTGPAVQPKIDQMTGQPKVDPATGEPDMEVVGLAALWTDPPLEHIKGALSVLDSPELRGDQRVVMAVTYHVMDHLKKWRQAPKDGLMLLGYPMPPPLPGDPMADPNAVPGGGPAGEKPVGGNGKAQGGMQEVLDSPKKNSKMPSLPKPAKNPTENQENQ